MTKKLIRETKQRRAIKQAFQEAFRPLSPMEVLTIACENVPNLGIATVYRNIKALCEEELLVAVELPGIATRYHIPGESDNVYFVCLRKNRVYRLENTIDGVKHELPKGFKMQEYRLIYYGVADVKAE